MTATAQQQVPRWATSEAVQALQAYAATRVHHLSAAQLDGRPLSVAAVLAMKRHLDRCPERTGAAGPVPSPPETPVTAPVPPSYGTLVAQVPDGRYATPSRTGTNDLDFWVVHTKQRGAHAGRRFIDRVLGGQDPVALKNLEARYALQAILDLGTEASGMLYAEKTGECRDCGHLLTDEASRAAGRGPVCRAKH